MALQGGTLQRLAVPGHRPRTAIESILQAYAMVHRAAHSELMSGLAARW